MTTALLIVIVVVLLIVAAMTAFALQRVAALLAARDAAARAAAEVHTRLEVLSAQGADLERDLKQDLAIARAEQAGAAQSARTEFGAHLAQLAQTLQQQRRSLAHPQHARHRDATLQLGGRAFRQLPPRVDDAQAMAQLLCLGQIVRAQQHRPSAQCCEVAHVVAHAPGRLRV